MYGQGYFEYIVEGGSAVVVGYLAQGNTVVVPQYLGGYPVSRVATGAFSGNTALQQLSLPDTLMVLDEGATVAGVQIAFYETNPQQEQEEPEPSKDEPVVPDIPVVPKKKDADHNSETGVSSQLIFKSDSFAAEDVTEEALQDEASFEATKQAATAVPLNESEPLNTPINHTVVIVIVLAGFLLVVVALLVWLLGRSKRRGL